VKTSISIAEGSLDFRVHTANLPDAAGPWRAMWSARVGVKPGQSRLLDIEGGPALTNAPTGIIALGDAPPGDERLLAGLRVAARPGLEGGALLFDDAGRLYRWSPGKEPRQVWETGTPPDKLEAVALKDELLLVQRPITHAGSGGTLAVPGSKEEPLLTRGLPPGAELWTTELVEPGVGVRWARDGDLRGMLPWNDTLLVIFAGRHAVGRLRVADGSTIWERAIGARVAALIAVVANRLWLRTYDGELIALDTETGVVETRVRVPLAAVPDGVVDEAGQLHLCTGASYTILDLAEGGATIASSLLPSGDEGPSLVFGSAAIPTSDGRLIFFDRNGRIFASRAGDSRNLTLLWDPPSPLLDCRAARGTLFILDGEGLLSALRP